MSPLRIRSAATALAATLLLFGAGPARGWDALGHEAVAHLAWEHLTQEARETAVELLEAAPRDADLAQLKPFWSLSRERELFARASTWPDIVRDRDLPERRDKYHRSRWHYINFFFDQEGPEGAARERTDLSAANENVVERLGKLEKSLGDTGRSAAERGVDLAWVLHLVGDLHQPLHTTARVTEAEPEGDRGGNLFLIGERDSLHFFWDSVVRRTQPGFRSSRATAGHLETLHPRASLAAELGPRDYRAWARDGFEVAQEVVYPATLERGVPPSPAYTRNALEVARRRMALAAYRLADLLNEVLAR